MERVKPKQLRSIEVERKILNAAQKVFSDKGYHGSTISDIVSEANSSTGNFYYRFKNKEALFYYMLDCFVDKINYSLDNIKYEFNSAEEIIFVVIKKNTEILSENRGFYRAITEMSIKDPVILNKLRQLTEKTADIVVDANLRLTSTSIMAKIPEVAIREAIRLVSSILANQASSYSGGVQLDNPENIFRLYKAAMGILIDYPLPDLTNITEIL